MARMDDATLKHFNAWCEREWVGEEFDNGDQRARMVAEWQEDPDHWERAGWRALHDYVCSVDYPR